MGKWRVEVILSFEDLCLRGDVDVDDVPRRGR